MLITPQELELHRIIISKTYAAGALDFHSAEFKQRGPLKTEAVAELVGDEIRIRGHLGTHIEACCDRCLAPVDFPIERDFDLSYRPVKSIARGEEIEISEDELEVGFYSGNGIALADIVAEQVILAVPMKIICQANCLGLCPVCGVNRNLEVCGCLGPRPDYPFASLKED